MIRLVALLVLVPTLFPAFLTAQASPVAPSRLLTDFAGDGIPLTWRTVNDGVMGGRSRGSYRVDNGVLRFEGSLNTNGGGFASIRAAASDPLRLESGEGVLLRVRGDGRTYMFRLEQVSSNGRRNTTSYRAEFETRSVETQDSESAGSWQDVWLPFAAFVPTFRGRTLDLPPVDPARVREVGLMLADKQDGPFALEVDSLRVYPPFDMKQLRRTHRPLVVFAPAADDPRLLRQFESVRDSESGFRERDMVWILVLESGQGSCVGARPLASAAARELRERFGARSGEFGVHLVGKDGGVKRSDDAPLTMAELFGQIDAMPMRRAEVEAARERRGN